MPCTTVKSVCKFGACEPQCGLEFDIEHDTIVRVRPDPTHPLSKGYACVKGMAIPEYQNDENRLLYPEQRSADGWTRATWTQATRDIGQRLKHIADTYGPTSIATYWGNAADSSAMIGANTLCSAFGSPNSFNVLSLEYTDRGAVAERMFGNEHIIVQPDADETDYALLIGTNPLVTQGMALLQRRPRIAGDLKAIKKQGGKVVVIDPRVTETTRIASEHLMIRPGTDLFFLLALIKLIIERKRYHHDYVNRYLTGFEWWKSFVASLDIGHLSQLCGLSSHQIETVAEEFSGAKRGFITTRVGVQTSHNTALTEWAVQVLNCITGRIGNPGGLFYNPGGFDTVSLIKFFTRHKNTSPSRIGHYPQIFGGPPASTFADNVLSDDEGRIRALIVIAGNPALSFPHAAKVEQALKRLDLLVCIDIYRSETGTFAHYNLPAATLYEKGGFHFLTQPFNPRPYAEWRKKLVNPRGDARPEWDIMRDISRAAGVNFLNDTFVDLIDRGLSLFGNGLTEAHFSQLLLLSPFSNKKISLRKLQNAEHGTEMGSFDKQDFFNVHIQTQDKRARLDPDDFKMGLLQALENPPLPTAEYPFLLISGGRRLSTFNTWSKNLPSLMQSIDENHAVINNLDAQKKGIIDGDRVQLQTETGQIEIKVKTTPDIREGVIMAHQFWGHKFDTEQTLAKQKPGVNVNYLHSDKQLCPFTGMPVFNGTPCNMRKISHHG